MFDEYMDQIRQEAIEAYPQEAVWLITKAGCTQVKNVHPDPEASFAVDKADLLRANIEGLLAVVHSHPDAPDCPSASDMQGQMQTAVPWAIVSTDGEGTLDPVWWGQGVEPSPLTGRGFRHGISDCYALIRDYYQITHQMTLPEFPRDWEWWLKDQSLYTDGFAQAGFRELDVEAIKHGHAEPQAGDVWLAQIRSDTPNHGGIYLANDMALHHPASRDPVDASRISRREPVYRWLPHITHWLRHETL